MSKFLIILAIFSDHQGHKFAGESSSPSVKETIDLVRAMQSLRVAEEAHAAVSSEETPPEIPEEDYPIDDTEVMARRRSSIVMWGKIDARSKASAKINFTLQHMSVELPIDYQAELLNRLQMSCKLPPRSLLVNLLTQRSDHLMSRDFESISFFLE